MSPFMLVTLTFARSLRTSMLLLALLVFNDFNLRFLNPDLHRFLNLERTLLESIDFMAWTVPVPVRDGHTPGLIACLFLGGFILLNLVSWMLRRTFFFGSRDASLTRFLLRTFSDGSRLIGVYLQMMVGTCFYFLTYHALSHAFFHDPSRPISNAPRLAFLFCVSLTLAAWFERTELSVHSTAKNDRTNR